MYKLANILDSMKNENYFENTNGHELTKEQLVKARIETGSLQIAEALRSYGKELSEKKITLNDAREKILKTVETYFNSIIEAD